VVPIVLYTTALLFKALTLALKPAFLIPVTLRVAATIIIVVIAAIIIAAIGISASKII